MRVTDRKKRVPSRDGGDPAYQERLRRDTEALRTNVAWNDRILPHLERRIREIERDVLENDNLGEQERTVQRHLRRELLAVLQKARRLTGIGKDSL